MDVKETRTISTVPYRDELPTRHLQFQLFDEQKFTGEILLNYLFILFFVRPPCKTSLLKPPAFQRDNPALEKHKISYLGLNGFGLRSLIEPGSNPRQNTAIERRNMAEEIT